MWGEEGIGCRYSKGTNFQLKINTRDVMYNMINTTDTVLLYMKVVKRVNVKSSYHKEKHFSLFL